MSAEYHRGVGWMELLGLVLLNLLLLLALLGGCRDRMREAEIRMAYTQGRIDEIAIQGGLTPTYRDSRDYYEKFAK